MKNQIKMLCGAVALVMAGHVSADATWTLGSSYGTKTSGVTVTAYANTGGADNSVSAANQTIQNAPNGWISTYGGIANADGCNVVNSTCDYGDQNPGANWEHSIDNDQRYDMALLNFTAGKVTLSSVILGNAASDSDITVFAYTGSNIDPTTNGKLTGLTYDKLVANGWEKIGNYYDVYSRKNAAGTDHSVDINAGRTASSFWLIGAYNPLAYFEGKTATGGDTLIDKVKLSSVTSCVSGTSGCVPTNKVPEPGSLALFGLAIVGAVGARRNRKS